MDSKELNQISIANTLVTFPEDRNQLWKGRSKLQVVSKNQFNLCSAHGVD